MFTGGPCGGPISLGLTMILASGYSFNRVRKLFITSVVLTSRRKRDSTNDNVMRPLCGVFSSDGPCCGSDVPLPTLAITDDTRKFLFFSRIVSSSYFDTSSRIMSSISLVMRFDSSMLVPIGFSMKMLTYCGSPCGKKITLGGNNPKSTNERISNPNVPMNNQRLRPSLSEKVRMRL